MFIFEYDIPHDQTSFLNAGAGIWSWTLSPGTVTVTDDNGHTGFYNTTNAVKYNVKSARQDDLDLAPVASMDDLVATNASFYYDHATTKIYFHFDGFAKPINGMKVVIGLPVGFSKNCVDEKPYFYGVYYSPLLSKVSEIKKSMDRAFYGTLKYTTGKVTLINADGEFDDWGSRNLYRQPCRILKGDVVADYLAFDVVVSGFIGDYSYDHESITIEIDDPRKGLTQPVARNTLNKTDYPDLSDGDVDRVKPVIFGTVFQVPLICLNSEATSPANWEFLICDDEFFDANYSISSVANLKGGGDAIATYVRTVNIITIPASTAVGDGTIEDVLDSVTCDVTTSLTNGADIIRYLLYYYDGKPYLSAFFNTTEWATARAGAAETGVYVDEADKKLTDIIKSVCMDIDGRFFSQWNGKYSLRLYDDDRTPTLQIPNSLWLGTPDIANNGSEYMSSCIIKYHHNIDADEYEAQYEETSLKTSAHDTYKAYKTESFETNLLDATAAAVKGLRMMQQSYLIGDIVSRSVIADSGTVDYSSSLEIGDFIIGNPKRRTTAPSCYGDKEYLYGTESMGVYETIGINKNLDGEELKLTLRYVKAETEYYMEVDSDGDFIIDSDGAFIIAGL